MQPVSINQMYADMLNTLAEDGVSADSRVEQVTTLPCAYTYHVDISDIEAPAWRHVSLSLPYAEVLWWLGGDNTIKWLEDVGHGDTWRQEVNKHGIVPGAYGARWRRANPRGDQILHLITALIGDPTRRAMLITSNSYDAHTGIEHLPPCIQTITFTRRGRDLRITAHMRSQDVVYGVPYDVMALTILAYWIADAADLRVSTLSVCVSDLHVYRRHDALVQDMRHHIPDWLGRYIPLPKLPEMPSISGRGPEHVQAWRPGAYMDIRRILGYVKYDAIHYAIAPPA